MALHQTARFGLAQQSAKGTAAVGITVPYIRGRVLQHGMSPRYEMIDTAGEHTGVHTRSTALQSTPIRAGSIIDVSFRHRLYPSMVGLELIGLGFSVSTSTTVILTIDATGGTFTMTAGTTSGNLAETISAADLKTALDALSGIGTSTVTGSAGGPYTLVIDSSKTASTLTASGASLTGGASTATFSGWYYTHTFTLAAADSESWLSAYDFIGESGGFDRVVQDVRLSQLSFTADATGIIVAGSGLGIVMLDATGQTFTAETDAVLSQANGSFTLTAVDSASGAITTGTPRSSTLTVDRPLSEDEQELHTMNRATFASTGTTVTGTIAGLPFSETLFKQLNWGLTAGTAAVIPYPVTSAFTWNWRSSANISTAAAVPYICTFSVPIVQLDMQAVDVSGGGSVLFDIAWRMTDSISTAPITITLQNSIESYAGT